MRYTVWLLVVHTKFRMCYHSSTTAVDVCVLALGEEQLLSCHMAPNLTTLRLRHDILISSAANSTPVAFHSFDIYRMEHTYIASHQLPLN